MRSRRLRALTVAAVAVATAGLSACSRAPTASPAPVDPGWERVALAGSPDIATLTSGDRMVIGTSAHNGAAGMSTVSGSGALAPVTLRPVSGYARTARWLQVSMGGPGILAVGGARGGAHGNVRWTVWRAPRTTDGLGTLSEMPQTFETFGGLQAGDLVGAAYAGSDAVIVGSWVGSHGLDVTTWHPSGSTWLRDPPSPVLRNTSSTLKSANGVGVVGDRFVVVGDLLDLDHGMAFYPVVWLRAATGGPWEQHRVPVAGHARSIGCSPQRCVVVGATGAGAARAWQVSANGTVTPIDLPSATVTGTDIPTPVVVSDTAWIVLPTRSGSLLVRIAGARRTVLRTPAGHPVALAAVGTQLYLAIRAADGSSQLWRAAGTP
ncbi:hypothetical protein [Allobranchiibius sp. CTAmp26]|uniref:hypothetical protein n=1 Tax=Allobranchiibius sp. CTAmp26 TaxID=2815214 RepID=UPI001AA1796D|nr:hypothetical protein [Allobranchiibius sp. CTAmp26]MBO1754959.1 hypothetical protein [Allobranchiibius sp. CTAmp26]